MNREQFLQKVGTLREQGNSIRGIAGHLGVHPSRVQRALKTLSHRLPGRSEHTEEAIQASLRLLACSFIGRRREMGELMVALQDVASGRGRVVMLVGDAGIGKTRTAQEFQSFAEARDSQVYWGRCHEQPVGPPYWPWVQVLRSCLARTNVKRVLEGMGPAVADIALMAPEFRDSLSYMDRSTNGEDPEQARFRLYDCVTTFLKEMSKNQPLVLVLDNLHWADPSSLRLLEFVAEELSESHLLILGTYRDAEVSRGHHLFHALGDLSRRDLFHRIQLEGLSLDEVRELIIKTARVQPAEGVVAMVHGQTEGNPLFVKEMVRLLAEDDMLAVETLGLERWDLRLSKGVREVIGRRLAGLSDHCQILLTQASMVGREFNLPLITILSDLPAEKTLDLLEEAVAKGIVEETQSRVGRYQFTHSLIQRTLAAEISAARRIHLHARIAEALEGMYGDEIDEHASELAYHFSEAESIVGPEKGIKYSKLAGAKALDRYAHEDAIGHFKRALSLSEGRMGKIELADMLHGLGRAEAAVLAHDDALDHLRQAFDLFIEVGDVDRAAEIAGVAYTGRRLVVGIGQMSKQILDVIPLDSLQAGWVLTVYGRYLGIAASDTKGGIQACEEALRIAERHGDRRLEFRALAILINLSYGHRTQKLIHRALRLTGSMGSLWDKSTVDLAAVGERLRAGDLVNAGRHARDALTSAKRLGDRERVSTALWSNVIVARCAGDWSAARDFAQQALAVWPDDSRILGELAFVECETGEFAQADARLQKLLDLTDRPGVGGTSPGPYSAWVIARMARIAGNTDRIGLAKEIIASDTSSAFDRIDFGWVPGLIAVVTEDSASAKDWYEKLLAVPELSPYDTSWLLGLLARTIGKLGDSVAHFERALRLLRSGPFPPMVAWTSYDYAGALLQRAESGDREAAKSLVRECIAIAGDLGMKPLHQRAIALLERVESMPAKGPVYPAGLTVREAEVLRLVAAGKTDREIADEMVISISTVGHHVSNILHKTGSINRTEAAAFAVRNGLV